MATWYHLASENRTAANDLLKKGSYRPCVSRAYYATFALGVHRLYELGIGMPAGKESPSHTRLRIFLKNNLSSHDSERRATIANLTGTLYDLRIICDYRPSIEVTSRDAHQAIAIVAKVFGLL